MATIENVFHKMTYDELKEYSIRQHAVIDCLEHKSHVLAEMVDRLTKLLDLVCQYNDASTVLEPIYRKLTSFETEMNKKYNPIYRDFDEEVCCHNESNNGSTETMGV